MSDPNIAPEYVAARRAVLDVLEVLHEQCAGLILVGAQAVYLHAPADQTRQPTYTTDGDLAIDPDLLTERPDIGETLLAAGYQPHSSPGTFFAPNGIEIDLMVPAGALPPSSRRTAPLRGQSPSTARRTAGLELALLDSAPKAITALDPADARTVTLRVAGPAALAVAKLTKLAERLAGLRRERVLSKDAGDLLRLLRYCDAQAIGHRLHELSGGTTGSHVIEPATGFLRDDLSSRNPELIRLAVDDLDGIEPAAQVETAFRVLAARMLAAYGIDNGRQHG
ncbi:hypothetical protein OSC27_00340 [Microbacterium sp. STN6]|uniref:hypothetical protein n=1 Tax=Microbacterium sp. STN6 TaxID=2995588 RepID=UPI0022610426|nr:hypothetical protein [Microbacterium sp. STN6]MCX7520720.1 hypothetical protein [Microbacterium sp. STN6]